MGADARRPRRHDLLDACFKGCLKSVAAEITQHDSGVVHYRTSLSVRRLNPLLDVPHAVGGATGGEVSARTILCAKDAGLFPFCRQATREPVLFARPIVEDLAEPKSLEPPRSSWAQVSQCIMAVNDHRPLALELMQRLFVQPRQRDVARSWQVLVLINLCRQHLDKLCPRLEEFLNLLSVDGRWHGVSPGGGISLRVITMPLGTLPAARRAAWVGHASKPLLISGPSQGARTMPWGSLLH
jgi:hypothetical protein